MNTTSTLNPASVIILTQVLSELIENNSLFTCYDVTRILRHRQVDVDHQSVREIVHGLSGTNLPPFKDSGYVRNSYVPVGSYYAEVYAPSGVDAHSLYNANELDPNAPPVVKTSPPVSPPATAPAPSYSRRIDDKRRRATRDSRNRVCIHNKFLAALSLSPGDMAYVSVRKNNPGLVVLNKASKTGHIQTYKVDRSGNIRLTNATLKKAQLGNALRLKVRLSDDNRAIVVVEE